MIQNVYHNGSLIASAEVSRPRSDTIGREAIDAAIGLGYSVECEGLLYGDPSLPLAYADDPRMLDD